MGIPIRCGLYSRTDDDRTHIWYPHELGVYWDFPWLEDSLSKLSIKTFGLWVVRWVSKFHSKQAYRHGFESVLPMVAYSGGVQVDKPFLQWTSQLHFLSKSASPENWGGPKVMPEFPALFLVQINSLFSPCPITETQHPRVHRPSCLGQVHSEELEGEKAIYESRSPLFCHLQSATLTHWRWCLLLQVGFSKQKTGCSPIELSWMNN